MCCVMFAACCALCVVGWLVVCCGLVLIVARCELFAVRRLLCVVCWLQCVGLCVGCCASRDVRRCVACCLLYVGGCLAVFV